MVHQELQATLNNEKQLGAAAIQNIISRYDYHEAGGAPLLGIDGICIICHGSSTNRAIRSALAKADQYVRSRLNEAIVEELEHVPHPEVQAST
jgi:glycerol-3-phosphate acyltransferase PlsX